MNAGERLLDLLEPDDNVLFYTSPYKRTIQTTEGIIKSMKKHNVSYRIHEESRLREQDFGNFQGTPTEMAKIWKERAHYGHFFYRIPNGESGADVYDRVAGFNETLFRQFSADKFPSVLVLVSHGIWCRVFLTKWFRWSYEKFETFRNLGHCEFLIMEKQPDSHKYALLTPLRTWDDPPDEVIVAPTLERNESNKHVKSLRFQALRTRDESSTEKQKEKDARIKKAFIKAQKEEQESNGTKHVRETLSETDALEKSASSTGTGTGSANIATADIITTITTEGSITAKSTASLASMVPKSVLSSAKCLDEADGEVDTDILNISSVGNSPGIETAKLSTFGCTNGGDCGDCDDCGDTDTDTKTKINTIINTNSNRNENGDTNSDKNPKSSVSLQFLEHETRTPIEDDENVVSEESKMEEVTSEVKRCESEDFKNKKKKVSEV